MPCSGRRGRRRTYARAHRDLTRLCVCVTQLLTSLELAKEQMDAFTENLRKYLAKYIQDKVVRRRGAASHLPYRTRVTLVCTTGAPGRHQFKILDWNVEQLVRRGFNREFLLGQVELGANDNFDVRAADALAHVGLRRLGAGKVA